MPSSFLGDHDYVDNKEEASPYRKLTKERNGKARDPVYYHGKGPGPTGSAGEELARPPATIPASTFEGERDPYIDFLEKDRDLALTYQERIIRDADAFHDDQEVWSVILKDQAAASGDMHDYLSLARYFWPETQADGTIKYVRKDGYRNPEVETVNDYFIMRKMYKAVQSFGYAYFFTGNESYADKAVYRLNEWFVDPETKMNPNLRYASMVKGNPDGRRVGVLDGYMVYRMFSGIPFLKMSSAWTPELSDALQKWFEQFYTWLSTSKQGKAEYKAPNNHGTYASLQNIVVLEFLGRREEAMNLVEDALVRRWSHIEKDGVQPKEAERPTSWYYSSYNLQALMLIAESAQRLGMGRKAWDYVGKNGGSIKNAIEYMAQFVKEESEGGIGNGWPHGNINGFETEEALERLERNLEAGYLMYGSESMLRALKIIRKKRPSLKLALAKEAAVAAGLDESQAADIKSGTEPYSVKWGCRMAWNAWSANSITACT